ncbi:hypothetical protein [Streptomyces sp. NPDC001970]
MNLTDQDLLQARRHSPIGYLAPRHLRAKINYAGHCRMTIGVQVEAPWHIAPYSKMNF